MICTSRDEHRVSSAVDSSSPPPLFAAAGCRRVVHSKSLSAHNHSVTRRTPRDATATCPHAHQRPCPTRSSRGNTQLPLSLRVAFLCFLCVLPWLDICVSFSLARTLTYGHCRRWRCGVTVAGRREITPQGKKYSHHVRIRGDTAPSEREQDQG